MQRITTANEMGKFFCELQATLTCLESKLNTFGLLLDEQSSGTLLNLATHRQNMTIALPVEDQRLIYQLGQGASLKRLSTSLHLSKSSVERRIRAVCRQCGVANRSQLIVWGTLHGYCMITPNADHDEEKEA